MKKLLGFILVLMLTGCMPKALYNWGNYDSRVYSYVKSPNEATLADLLAECERLMSDYGSRNVPPPGLCADYGYLLIKSGKVAEGKEMLNKEISLYPESKVFVERILTRFAK